MRIFYSNLTAASLATLLYWFDILQNMHYYSPLHLNQVTKPRLLEWRVLIAPLIRSSQYHSLQLNPLPELLGLMKRLILLLLGMIPKKKREIILSENQLLSIQNQYKPLLNTQSDKKKILYSSTIMITDETSLITHFCQTFFCFCLIWILALFAFWGPMMDKKRLLRVT